MKSILLFGLRKFAYYDSQYRFVCIVYLFVFQFNLYMAPLYRSSLPSGSAFASTGTVSGQLMSVCMCTDCFKMGLA